MLTLLFFSFISGLVTILAPCIWPLLPIVLSASSTGGKRKPLGITLGIIVSFAIFTLSISYIIKIIPFDPDILRLFAVAVIGFLGLTLVVPKLGEVVEGLVSKFSGRFAKNNSTSDFRGGLITGISLGLVWSPCAGPILATIATLAATQSVNLGITAVTFAYVLGVGIPLFILSTLGQKIFTQTKSLSKFTGTIQKIFGIIMIATALAILTNFDKTLQTKLLDTFPSYSNLLTKLESNQTVTQQLNSLKGKKQGVNDIVGQPISPANPNMLPILGKAPEFTGISHWINSETPLTLTSLKGKVVLVDFWTYTCINCIRTLPYVTSWYEKYKQDGFIVIGVHTPEFEFEKKTENVVTSGIEKYSINYPVAQDNDYATWNAYNNQYWPAKYLIDKDGFVRYVHFGEGNYEETEKNIQKLLIEDGVNISQNITTLPNNQPSGPISPETYFGLYRFERFSSPENPTEGIHNYSLPTNLATDYFAFGGSWNLQQNYSETTNNSILEFQFQANKVYLVAHPKSNTDSVKVYLDGVLIKEIQIKMPDRYSLIDSTNLSGTRKLRLEFLTPGVQIYTFTFG